MIQFDVHIFQMGFKSPTSFPWFHMSPWHLQRGDQLVFSLPCGVFSLNMCKVTMMTPSICGSTNPPSEIRPYEGKPIANMPLIRSYFWWGGWLTSHDLRYPTCSDNIRSEGQLRGNVRPKTGPSSKYSRSYCDSEDVKTSHPKQIEDYTRTMISTMSIVKPPCLSL